MANIQDQLTPENLHAALADHPFVNRVIYRSQVGSTNDVAKEQANQAAREGLLVITDEQTGGRGRLGRRWWAPPGSALLTSLLFRPAIAAGQAADPLHTAQQFVMLCALAAADAVTAATDLPVDLKWPNDLMLNGQKLAGLLAESVFQGDRLDAVIVGLGINVNVDLAGAPPFVAPATSLAIEKGHSVDRLSLLVEYLDRVALRRAQVAAGVTPHTEWSSRLITLGQQITAYLGGPQASGEGRSELYLSGVAEAVDASGALLLRSPDGAVHRLLAADVSLQHHPPPQR